MVEMKEIIVLVIAILVGIALLGGIVSNLADMTDTKPVVDDSANLVLGGGCTAYTTQDNYVSNSTVSLANANGTLVEETDYIICSKEHGLISAITADSQGATNINYTYYPDGYLESSVTRSLIGLIPFAFIIALIMGAFAVAGVMKV